MKKQTFISTAFILLFFMNSCTKTNTGVNNENDPPPDIAFQFFLIDKDSNTLYKYPDVLNTKYDPHQLYAIGQNGDTMTKIYTSYKPDSTIINCDIDTLKANSVFWITLIGSKINFKYNNIYYIHYNSNEIDTLLVNPNKYYDKGGYFEYNGDSIAVYRIGKYSYKGAFLIIK